MSSTIIYTIVSLSLLGFLSAVILYFVAQQFKVVEDPRIDEVEGMLPGANCGGCGYAGCRQLAETMVKSDDMENLNCPVSEASAMVAIAKYLGHEASAVEPKIAVVRCNGTCENKPKTNTYDGASSCVIASALYSGDSGCSYGCLGHGDCVVVCKFGAMYMDPLTGLPVIIEEKCVSCGACVKACPKKIIELRNKGKNNRRIYISCVNKDKGGVARKACTVACIGCGKCVKVCAFDAISLENNLAYIDFNKCKLCRKCAPECPTNAILEINFPAPKKANSKIMEATDNTSEQSNTTNELI